MSKAIAGRGRALSSALCLAALTTACMATLSFAEANNTPEIFSVDGPAFVPSAALVGDGNMQVETSVNRLQDGENSQLLRVWSTPTLVRFGMPNYEVRLQSQAYSHVRTRNAVNTGMSDISVGMKGILPQSIRQNLSVAWMVQAAFPSGSSTIKNEGVRPSFELMSQWQMPNGFSAGAMAGLRSDVAINNDRYPTGLAGVNLSRTWNPQFSTYGELAGREIRSAVRGGKNMMWNAGAGWRVMPQMQLDAVVGKGLKDNDTDLAYSVAISRRFSSAMPAAWSHKHEEPKPAPTPTASSDDGK